MTVAEECRRLADTLETLALIREQEAASLRLQARGARWVADLQKEGQTHVR